MRIKEHVKVVLAWLWDPFIRQKLIWLTQGINCMIFAGQADESTSSRAYRLRDRWFWSKMRNFIDWVFNDPDHCMKAYESEAKKVESWNR